MKNARVFCLSSAARDVCGDVCAGECVRVCVCDWSGERACGLCSATSGSFCCGEDSAGTLGARDGFRSGMRNSIVAGDELSDELVFMNGVDATDVCGCGETILLPEADAGLVWGCTLGTRGNTVAGDACTEETTAAVDEGAGET